MRSVPEPSHGATCYPVRTMRTLSFLSLFLIFLVPGIGQTADNPKPTLPKEPREVFAAAAPFYDFSDPALKPWHMKVTYQLYDEKGKPSEQGTYEYWWASPQVHRSTWNRPSATHIDWYTADGKHAYAGTGEALNYFESQLQSMLLSPLPNSSQLNPNKFFLDKKKLVSKGSNAPCYRIVPVTQDGISENLMYCFDAQLPIVVGINSHGTLLTMFRDFVQMQGRSLPREVEFRDGSRNVLTAKVDSVGGLSSLDAALTPPSDAILVRSEKLIGDEKGITQGKVIKRAEVEFPKGLGSGTVWLQITVGADGRVHDPNVITSTSPALAAVALKSVSQWLYAPYKLNGEPVDALEEIGLSVKQDR